VEVLPKHIFIPEVVREEKMHWYEVPRLGSYLAIKMEYNSCLSEEAFDAALKDYQEVSVKKEEQEKEIEEHKANVAQAQAAWEEEDHGDEPFVPEEKTWEAIDYAPYKTEKVQFVVCLNTMGQDREFTEEQKKFALREVQAYRDRWEVLEQENLLADIMAKNDRSENDKFYKEHFEQQDSNALSKIVDEAVSAAAAGNEEENFDPAEKAIAGHKSKFV
jgi:hypothetical protein